MRAIVIGASLGREVRRRREGRDLSLGELSKRTGLTQNYIGSVELGHRDPSLSTVLSIANGLGIHPGELFGTIDGLSPISEEAARLYEHASPEVQAATMALLRLMGAKPRK